MYPDWDNVGHNRHHDTQENGSHHCRPRESHIDGCRRIRSNKVGDGDVCKEPEDETYHDRRDGVIQCLDNPQFRRIKEKKKKEGILWYLDGQQLYQRGMFEAQGTKHAVLVRPILSVG